jgi:hypothetical protein
VSTDRLARAVAIALLAASVVLASGEQPSLQLEASPTSVRVGDRVRVVVSARGGDGWLWGEPTVKLEDDGPWELVDPPAAVTGARPPAWELTMAPMSLGEQPLPPVAVSVRPPEGDAIELTSADLPTVTVVSTLAESEDDRAPAPLRDPIGARGLPWEWILPIGVVVLPLFIIGAWWWRGRGRPSATGRRALAPLPELEALLAELANRVGRAPADGVCDRLAAGLRRYLERRTGEPAAEMTSFELRLLARRRGWPEPAQRLIQQVMAVADGVRFSRRPVSDDELQRAIGLAADAAHAVESSFEAPDEPVIAEAG